MRIHGIKPRYRRKFRPTTTDSTHSFPVAPNLLDRHFEAVAPNRVWVADITYIPTREGWMYLAVLLDLFSRPVVGWAMSSRITRESVSYTHLRAHETKANLVCRLLLEK